HHAEAIALVAAELAAAAERRHEALLHGDVGIGGGLAVLVERPAGGNRLLPAARDAELAGGHRGRRHVEYERRVTAGRRRARDRRPSRRSPGATARGSAAACRYHASPRRADRSSP